MSQKKTEDFLCNIDQQKQPSTGTPDNNDLEKHYIDAKAFILSATTKDGSNL